MSGSAIQLGGPPPPLAPDPPAWPPAAQWLMAVFVAVGLALVGYRGYGLSRYSAQPLPIERELLDLNDADEIDLRLLPGIGPAMAKRIHDARPYRSVDDLRRVPGVGPETLSRLRPLVRVSEPQQPPPRVVRAKPHDEPLDLNRATAEELMRIPGIGPVLAKRIVEGRPYRSVADLRRVKGIGVKTLDKLKPHVAVEED